MGNEGIADIFLEIADLLDLEGVKFKPEAYRRAARTLQQIPQDVKELVKTGKIDDVPGIGEALSEKVREYVATGRVPYLEKLRQQWPPGLLELMRLEGVGPKTTRRFFVEFQVTSPQELERVIKEGKLRGVFGFGDRKIELLLKALAKGRAPPGEKGGGQRTALPEAQAVADELMSALRASKAPAERLVFAGSLRRRKETVGDLDLLATSSRPREVMDRFVHLDQVEEVRLSGETKSTVVLKGGIQVDLRVVPPEAFGAALQYFTGSKDHNVHLRTLANRKGLSISEYGLTQSEKFIQAPTEEEVYGAVGLSWVPPEMREDQGEIEAAASGKIPVVLQDGDVRGELHIHIPASTGREDLEPWIDGLRALGLRYGGFIVRAEDLKASGTTLEGLRKELPLEMRGVRILIGIEATLDPKGWPTVPFGADFLLARPPDHPLASPSKWREALTEEPPHLPALLGHLDAEHLAGAGIAWKDLLSDPGPPGPLEIAVSHERVVADTARVRESSNALAPVVVSALPRLPEELSRIFLAAGMARRGWTARERVVNARDDPLRPGPRSAGERGTPVGAAWRSQKRS